MVRSRSVPDQRQGSPGTQQAQPGYALKLANRPTKGDYMIRHTVVFSLKHAAGSDEEKEFLAAGRRLGNIPTVNNFECLRQISRKNSYRFGFLMEFESEEDYEFYTNHKEHVDFVQNRWIPEVVDFLEIDYEECEIV